MSPPPPRRGQHVVVVGLGTSGQAMAAYLLRRGVRVGACDDGAVAPTVWAALQALGVERLESEAQLPPDVAGVALSPGIDPRRHPLAQAAQAAQLPVWGELGLCGPLPCRSVGITGTNGKSTTTTLAAALLQGTGLRAFAGGNLGEPLLRFLDRGAPAQVAVLELSSYQLEGPMSFSPDVGVVLNLSVDHLERHGSMENYAAAKARLVAAVPPSGRIILNAADALVAAMAAQAQAPIWWFDAAGAGLPGAGLRCGDDARLVVEGAELAGLADLSLAHPRLLGAHNRANALAALLVVAALQPRPRRAALAASYAAFDGLPHRLQWAGEVDGVAFINDSKATNDAAAAIGIAAMRRPTVLLLGGRDKGGGYAAVCRAIAAAPIVHIICFGEAAPQIALALQQAGVRPPVERAVSGDAPLPLAQALAAAPAGGAVLLSPACASFDSFVNYEARGAALLAWVARRTKSPLADPAGEGVSR